MGGAFLRASAAIWALSRIRFDLLRRLRRRNVQELAGRYAKQGGTIRILVGDGPVRVHEVVDLVDGSAACGLIVRSTTGGTADDITCRACQKVHHRAVHAAVDLEAEALASPKENP